MGSSWKQGLAAFTSVAVVAALLAGCGTNSTSSGKSADTNANSSSETASTSGQKPVEGGSIILDSTQAVPDLDPAVAYDTTSAEVDSQIYQSLVTYDKNTYKIIPELASSYTVSPDGLTYTFKIRKGVTFSNGDPLTAQDFVFQLERILDKKMTPKPSPGNSFFEIIKGATAYYNGTAKTISGVSTPDKYTLVLTLSKPEKFFLQVLAMQFLSAVDPAYVKKVGNAAFDTTSAMGTGPFELKTNNQNKVVLVKNPHYWQKDQWGQQLPYLNQVTINVNNNDQVDALHWEQGQTAFMSPWLIGGDGIPASQYVTIMNTPKYKQLVLKQPANSIFYIGLNTANTINGKPNPLSNVFVRRAMEYGFDDSQFVKINNGAVLPLNQPLPSTMEGYVKNLDSDAKYGLNVAKAKEMLAKAGYRNGLTVDMWDENTSVAMKEDQAFQAMMKNIGITVKIHDVTWKDFLTKAMSGTAQVYQSGWVQDFPDASDFLNTLFNSDQAPTNNNTNYDNSQVDQWLNEAQNDTNQAQRDELYGKVINQVMSDAVWIPTIQMIDYYSVQPWVHGFYTSPVLYDPMSSIWVDPGH
ncbi:ABC transporter substrate-binding protein [Alicyclobacillus acidoterrestris]|uniref:ABC transporter substrate-binding protein n=1 Tax=Alicyclobacillus acidoterrestris (strain ATCC 49025 / DSM 3922 / CIP 106132 / NCIMB 13137 / GD3B) TaxID=1356854 RepID=T0BPK8_ALIAG|nr:ABC transporter substrate-binding protein [Alicyclobacillus acidoterrestris]EPZ42694.1 hypothetical protein N007_14415 [Alicyclobacillus acidoterrestris ATCC 49025]UNO47232.1 ABC transporter substrate-binding protein [Alicyclobacillus acidoterrestris]